MARRAPWIRGITLAALAATVAAGAGGEPVRVGTSGDYDPFSRAAGGAEPVGFDIAALGAWAADRGHEIVWVRFGWPKLLADLASGRFELAASGITVRPERSAAGRFTVPVAETAAFVLARTPERWGGRATLDRPQVRIAVNAGGHLERVARAHFPRASLIAVPDNDAVVALLADDRVHAVVTDSVEAPHWEARVEAPLARIGPLSLDRKAWLVRADRPDLAADLDAWLLAREADGSLGAWRAEYLGDADPVTADPLGALLAAVDERLALMPLVGVVKRRSGVALEVPEREALVLDRALEDLAAAAERAGREAPPEGPVRALFRAQLEAAKQVQWRAVKDPDFAPGGLPDLNEGLRPGLLRIGARIARLLLELPPQLAGDEVRLRARSALRAPYLDDATRDALADAITAVSAGLCADDRPCQQTGGEGQRDAGGVAQHREAPAQDRHLPGHEAVDRQ